MRQSSGFIACLIAIPLLMHTGSSAHAQAPVVSGQEQDLSSLSLEDLTRMEVSSVSRKDQELFKTPAAVYVITRDDIRNSGVSSIPELFRIVPGMQVAQAYANKWAVSSRGFNSIFADKMLVLIDGRSIYSEIYSGVFWGQNDLLLEDIERIEVIRGPGGTLWGANAVNGVINIITSKAKALNGSEVIAEGGNIDRMVAARTGGEIGRGLQYRTYFKDLRRLPLKSSSGGSANDAANLQSGGVRVDWQARASDWITVHGSLLDDREDEAIISTATGSDVNDKVSGSSGNVLTRWEHHFATSDFALQAYFSQEIHSELEGEGRERSLDFDFQHHLPKFSRNDVNWGIGYRLTTDQMGGSLLPFTHDHHRDALYSSFFEDDISLLPDRLIATLGVKLEHNSYSGHEAQPTARLLWSPHPNQSLWFAASRAVRTPSVQDLDLALNEIVGEEEGLPVIEEVRGNPNFRSEVLRAWEAGYRQRYGNHFSFDLAGFINAYSGLRNRIEGTSSIVTSPEVAIVVPLLYDNGIGAHSHGLEANLNWKPMRSLQLQSGYSWETAHLRLTDGSSTSLGDDWDSPTHTLNARANWNFARGWNWFTSYSLVTRLDSQAGSGSSSVSPYMRLDSHLSYSLSHAVQLRGGGDNLLEGAHGEFVSNDGYSVCGRIPRSAYLKLLWSF
ncbi:TonB-dependent receptor plug domain-containing protein [Telmatobacter bradus]|uniref:TonB-dependent receptor plug domain-containing protein n=1 Tax=Telmatobacter bradus TaxID=474953 RepID=UPI003B430FCD